MHIEAAAAMMVLLGVTGAAAAGVGGPAATMLLRMGGGLCIGASGACLEQLTAPKGFDLLVAFDLDSATLTPESRASLKAFAKTLSDERLATASFVVEGHSDARGDAAYNQTLSERRADAVRTYLLECGVAPEKLGVAGLGESDPRVKDPLDPANRRVEMRIRIR
jgi:outer membrane protein OmpA-like peptidoglycan-associated protein